MLKAALEWRVPVIAFATTVAFAPGIQGAATSPRWAVAALTLPWLHWSALPFVAWCWWKLNIDAAVHWSIITAAFCCGLRETNIEGVVKAVGAGMAANSALAIAQHFGFEGVAQVAGPSGLFLNKNMMGEMAALTFAAAMTVNIPWAAIVTLPAIALSGSRTAWLATIVVLFLSVGWRARAVLIIACASFTAWAFANHFNVHTYTLTQRFEIWQLALPEITWFGNGSYEFSNVVNREPNLHNDWMQLIYELGVVGLIPIAILLANRATLFVIALFIIGSLGFPFEMPATAWLAAFMLGHFLLRDAHASGVALCPWLANEGLRVSRSGA